MGEKGRREGGTSKDVPLHVRARARGLCHRIVLPEVAQETKEVSAVKGRPRLWVVTEKAGRLIRCQMFKVCGGRGRTVLNSVSQGKGKNCYREDGMSSQ